MAKNSTTMNFLALINHARALSGLSYGALAERMTIGSRGVSKGHLSRIFKGQDKPSRNTLMRIAIALSLSVQQTHELLVSAGHVGLVDDHGSQSRQEGRAAYPPLNQDQTTALPDVRIPAS